MCLIKTKRRKNQNTDEETKTRIICFAEGFEILKNYLIRKRKIAVENLLNQEENINKRYLLFLCLKTKYRYVTKKNRETRERRNGKWLTKKKKEEEEGRRTEFFFPFFFCNPSYLF